jgi:hypothetical protein
MRELPRRLCPNIDRRVRVRRVGYRTYRCISQVIETLGRTLRLSDVRCQIVRKIQTDGLVAQQRLGSSAARCRVKHPARNRIQFYQTEQLLGATQRINKC